jgi:hypothetical protein
MTHNDFNLGEDLIEPLKKFIKKVISENKRKKEELEVFLSKEHTKNDKKKPLLFLIETIKHKAKNI